MSYSYYAADQIARDILSARRSEAKQYRKWQQVVRNARELAKGRSKRG